MGFFFVLKNSKIVYKIKGKNTAISTMLMNRICFNGVTRNGYPQLKPYQRREMLVPQFDGDSN